MRFYREIGKPISTRRHSTSQQSCSSPYAVHLQWEGERPPEAAQETSSFCTRWAFSSEGTFFLHLFLCTVQFAGLGTGHHQHSLTISPGG